MLGGDLNVVKLESVNIHEILDHVNNLVVAENIIDQKESLGSDGSSSRKCENNQGLPTSDNFERR